MHLALLATPQQKDEVIAGRIADGVQLHWVNTLDELIAERSADAYFDFAFANETDRLQALASCLPKPVFINAVAATISAVGFPFIRFNAWPGFFKRPLTELAVPTEEMKDIAANIFESLGKKPVFVEDVPGLVGARIIAMIVNEAYFTAEANISSREEIDVAMKLGTNYPYGPFEWSQIIGLNNIYELLNILAGTDPLYRVAGALETDLRKMQQAVS